MLSLKIHLCKNFKCNKVIQIMSVTIREYETSSTLVLARLTGALKKKQAERDSVKRRYF